VIRVLGKKNLRKLHPLTWFTHFSMTAICFHDDIWKSVFHQSVLEYIYIYIYIYIYTQYIYTFSQFSRARFLAGCSAFLYLVAGIRERTTPVPWTLEINPLRVVESYGLSNGSHIKPVGFVLSGWVSDFWWYAGTHAHSPAYSMVYLIKITRIPY